MEEMTKLPSELVQFIPWNSSSHPLWLGTSLTFRRNINPFLFPQKLGKTESKELISLLKKNLGNHPLLKDSFFIPLEELESTERQFLFETFFNLAPQGALTPSSALVVDKTCHRMITLNLQDHLVIHVNDFEGQWEENFTNLMALDDSLSESLSFAFNDPFGYLTSSLEHCGTGFEARFYLHLPALLRQQGGEKFQKTELPESISCTDLQNASDGFLGDVVMVISATRAVRLVGRNHSLEHSALTQLLGRE